MADTEKSLTLITDGRILSRIALVVPPGASRDTDHFTSNMLVRVSKDESKVRFLCTDAYRLNIVTLSTDYFTIEGDTSLDLMIPAAWFAQHGSLSESAVTLSGTLADKEWKAVMAWGDNVEVTSHKVMDPWLLNIAKVFKDPDEITEDQVGVNVHFLDEILRVSKLWAWDILADVPVCHPLMINRLHPRGVNRFAVANDVGLLELGLMPLLIDDADDAEGYFDDDWES